MNETERRLLQDAASLQVQMAALSESLDAFLVAMHELAEARASASDEGEKRQ